jgi:hypothetical protein
VNRPESRPDPVKTAERILEKGPEAVKLALEDLRQIERILTAFQIRKGVSRYEVCERIGETADLIYHLVLRTGQGNESASEFTAFGLLFVARTLVATRGGADAAAIWDRALRSALETHPECAPEGGDLH